MHARLSCLHSVLCWYGFPFDIVIDLGSIVSYLVRLLYGSEIRPYYGRAFLDINLQRIDPIQYRQGDDFASQ